MVYQNTNTLADKPPPTNPPVSPNKTRLQAMRNGIRRIRDALFPPEIGPALVADDEPLPANNSDRPHDGSDDRVGSTDRVGSETESQTPPVPERSPRRPEHAYFSPKSMDDILRRRPGEERGTINGSSGRTLQGPLGNEEDNAHKKSNGTSSQERLAKSEPSDPASDTISSTQQQALPQSATEKSVDAPNKITGPISGATYQRLLAEYQEKRARRTASEASSIVNYDTDPEAEPEPEIRPDWLRPMTPAAYRRLLAGVQKRKARRRALEASSTVNYDTGPEAEPEPETPPAPNWTRKNGDLVRSLDIERQPSEVNHGTGSGGDTKAKNSTALKSGHHGNATGKAPKGVNGQQKPEWSPNPEAGPSSTGKARGRARTPSSLHRHGAPKNSNRVNGANEHWPRTWPPTPEDSNRVSSGNGDKIWSPSPEAQSSRSEVSTIVNYDPKEEPEATVIDGRRGYRSPKRVYPRTGEGIMTKMANPAYYSNPEDDEPLALLMERKHGPNWGIKNKAPMSPSPIPEASSRISADRRTRASTSARSKTSPKARTNVELAADNDAFD
ncbi:hypothetical protein M011DRAFT_477737 [Sporormia fimetaria CBS 119925]|uniref:Uncharacterized protein n=1 Tax=Sporormia fimetaria CBS 119925 TaxID=1340428 RepID=A0A6A6V8D3_9PLEO|nr:hypothetical protein M011DRAFT_477737 [Sporormia fimetaria CBS 119925]